MMFDGSEKSPSRGVVRQLQTLSEVLQRTQWRGRQLKICVVTSEILGPVKNGGIGTATSRLVEHMSSDGHLVTVLFTSVEYGTPTCEEAEWPYWVANLARSNVELAHIPHEGDYRQWRRKSWLVKEFLAERDIDVVCFNEHHGSGYYALAAKQAGVPQFASRIHCVFTHGAIEWVFDTNEQYISRPSDLVMMGLERRSVEWADVVISPSEYLLRKYESYGWKLPQRTYVQPYPFPFIGGRPDRTPLKVDELVFFGRLEARKGLWLFCEALEHLAEPLRGRVVTFMGRMTNIGGVPSAAYILERSARWPFQVRLLTSLDQGEALSYLSQPGRLAVMPSLADNSPCVVYECLSKRIPFVATSGSGAEELVHPDCWDEVMVEPTVRALSKRLGDVLNKGASLGWSRYNADDNLGTWSAWGDWLGSELEKLESRASADGLLPPKATPKISLVIIDCGEDSLGSVTDRVDLHRQRYGGSMRHLVLTSRMGGARETLEEMIASRNTGSDEAPQIFGTESIESLIQEICLADLVFFTDSEHEISSTFFASAVAAMVLHNAAAVSCASAERRRTDGSLQISELPCGDLPAAGGLGLPIGSSVWGASVRKIREILSERTFRKVQTDDLVGADELGQELMHQLIMAGKFVSLLPSVGGVRSRAPVRYPRQRQRYADAKQAAKRLGVTPAVDCGSAVWLGLNSRRTAESLKAVSFSELALRPEHPLNTVRQTGHDQADLAMFAAALGRADQAVRLLAEWDGDSQVSESLLKVAQASIEARERINLLPVLLGRTSQPQATVTRSQDTIPLPVANDFRIRLKAAIARQEAVEERENPETHRISAQDASSRASLIHGLSDGFFSSAVPSIARALSGVFEAHYPPDRSKVVLKGRQLSRSGCLTFVDVPLAGHDRVVANLTAAKHLPLEIRLNVVDQSTGGPIAEVATRVSHQGSARLVADLHGIYEFVSISLQFETSARSQRTPLEFDLNSLLVE